MPESPEAGPRALERVLGAIHCVEDTVLASLLGAMVLLSSTQIALRNLADVGLSWADPLLRIIVLWVGLLGALAASRGDRQISIDALSRVLPERAQRAVQALTALFTAGVAGLVAYHGGRFVLMDLEAGVPGIGVVPAWALELVIPVAFALIAVRYCVICALRLRDVARPPEHGQARPTEGDPARPGERS